MATIQNIRQRAQQLAEKWQKLSISPEEVGLLIDDLAALTNDAVINGSSLGIRRTYASLSAMQADGTAPNDQWGEPLKRGQLVAIASSDADAGKIYLFTDPNWAYVTTVDARYVTADALKGIENKLTELDNNMFRKGSGGYLPWQSGKTYNDGDVVIAPGGQLVECLGGSSGSSEYDPGEWGVTTIDAQSKKRDSVLQNAIDELGGKTRFYFTTLDVVSIDDGANVSAEEFEEIIKIQDAIKNQKTIISSVGILASSVVYRRPLYTASISYIIGNELRMMTAKTPLNGGGTWAVKSQDLSNLTNNGYNVLIHGESAHGEGVSSKLAYEGSTIPSDIQQVMMEWYMSPTGYSIAYGPGSHVEGQDCLATGDYAHAEGIKALAANDGAHAEGTGTNAAGTYAHAEGQSTTAYATACHAEGGMSVCNGNYGHVEGFRCTVENTAGHAEGYITYCRANYGHVEGRQTNSIGPCAHAEGYGNKIDRSITITSISNVEGYISYFKADNTSDLKVGACFIIDYIPYVVTDIVDGNVYVNRWIEFKQQKYDIIIMYGAAYGNNAHAEGELGSAIGNNSHVSGASCIAFNNNEVACGHYNYSFWSDDNAKRTLYSIGIGESDSNRKNASETKANGDLYIYGIGGYNGKNPSEAKTVQAVISELLNKIKELVE